MAPADLDERLRLAMFAHLDRFTFDGVPMRLTVQPGIWKPAMLSAALTIRTRLSERYEEFRAAA